VLARIEKWRTTGLSDGSRMPLFGQSRLAYIHERQFEETLQAALGLLSDESAITARSN